MPAEDRVDPHAERGALAGVFQYGVDAFVDADDLVTERSFAVGNNGLWYRCLRHGFGQDPDWRPDVASVLAHARTLGLADTLDAPDEVTFLRALGNMPVRPENVRKLAAKVRKLEVTRAAYGVVEEIAAGLEGVTGEESGQAILSLLEQPVYQFRDRLGDGQDADPKGLGDGLELWLEHLAANPVQTIGLPTGYRRLDRAIGGGLRKNSITLFGARSGMGKTFVGMNIGIRLACGAGYDWPAFDSRERVPVLYLDTEMDEEDHRYRNLANLSGCPTDLLERGVFDKDLKFSKAVREAAARLRDVPYDVKAVAGQPFEDTLAVMRRWVQRKVGLGPDGKAKDCLIVFDYLKLMDAGGITKNLQEFQLLGFMMTGLHNFSVRYGVPILAFCQLNRDGITSAETNAVGGSDRLLWLASNLVFHMPQTDEEVADQLHFPAGQRWNYKWVALKTRRGAGLRRDDFINIRTDFAVGRITEGPTKTEMKEMDPTRGFGTEGVGEVSFGAT